MRRRSLRPRFNATGWRRLDDVAINRNQRTKQRKKHTYGRAYRARWALSGTRCAPCPTSSCARRKCRRWATPTCPVWTSSSWFCATTRPRRTCRSARNSKPSGDKLWMVRYTAVPPVITKNSFKSFCRNMTHWMGNKDGLEKVMLPGTFHRSLQSCRTCARDSKDRSTRWISPAPRGKWWS